MKVKLLTETAKVPHRGSTEAAGYDLFADNEEPIILKPGERAIIPTNISIQVPENTYGRIAPRSGLAVKKGIDVMAGVIDRDYTGPVGVVLINLQKEYISELTIVQDLSIYEHTINRGDKIAQLILERIETPEVEVVDELETTERGSGGFGSTGNV